MKLIVFPNIFVSAGNKTAAEAFDYCARSAFSMYTLADTALLTRSLPFFIPDFAKQCTARAAYVLRIARQGRSIAPRFAHRYIDGVGAGVLFTAQPLLSELQLEGLPWGAAIGFDGSAVLGQVREICFEENQTPSEKISIRPEQIPPLTLCQNGTPRQNAEISHTAAPITDLVTLASRFYTLRQGDYIFLPVSEAAQTEVSINDHLTVSLGSETLTAFNVK